MGFIALKCPSWGTNIELDETREFGFCSYCGTKIAQDIQKVVISGKVTVGNEVKVQGVSTIENLLTRAEQYFIEGDLVKAGEYVNKALDIDATNRRAIEIKNDIADMIKERGIWIWCTIALIVIIVIFICSL